LHKFGRTDYSFTTKLVTLSQNAQGIVDVDGTLVLLPLVADAGDARKVAEDILRELSRPFMTEGFNVSISASLGVAVYPDCAPDADSLLRYADAAMYEAKLHGRGCVADLMEHQRDAA